MSNTEPSTPSERLREMLDTWGDNKTIPVPTADLRAVLGVMDAMRPFVEWALKQQADSRILGAIDTNTGQFVLYRPASPE